MEKYTWALHYAKTLKYSLAVTGFVEASWTLAPGWQHHGSSEYSAIATFLGIRTDLQAGALSDRYNLTEARERARPLPVR